MKILLRFIVVGISTLLVSCTGDYSQKLPGNYKFISESNNQQVIIPEVYKDGDVYIPCNVEDFNYNEKFIIVRQKVVNNCFFRKQTSIREIDDKQNFWIIDVGMKLILGPFNKESYLKKRQLLQISPALVFEK